MPNPVAVNDLTPISGSLQTSRISYGVDLKGKNYGQNYNGTKWYSDIPNDGTYYTIVSDNYTANYYISRSLAGGAYVEGGQPAVDEFSAPVFWTTQGTLSADITAVVNSLPDRKGQTPFTTGKQALNWIASSGNYFAIGPDYYRQIEGNNLVLNVEANQIISYPTTESSWYDLSGHSHNGDLRNDPTWNPNGWFDFDGTNDHVWVYGNGFQNDVLPSSSYVNRTLTLETVVKFDAASGTGGLITKWGNSIGQTWGFWRYPTTKLHLALDTSAGYSGLYSTGDIGGDTNRFYHAAATITGSNVTFYINGVKSGTSTANAGSWDLSPNCPVLIGAQNSGSATNINGQIAYSRVYSNTLSPSDIAQNYYGGPIFTGDLTLAMDSSNLVSYPRTGVDSYDLGVGGLDGVLNNGTLFVFENGGYFELDGVDDYIEYLPPFNIPEAFTIDFWAYIDPSMLPLGGARGGIVSTWPSNYSSGFAIALTTHNSVDVIRSWTNDGAGGGVNWANAVDVVGKWNHFAISFEGNRQTCYLNGEQVASEVFGGGVTPGQPLWVGNTQTSGYNFTAMKIASLRCYDRPLTQQEIQQNYNATK